MLKHEGLVRDLRLSGRPDLRDLTVRGDRTDVRWTLGGDYLGKIFPVKSLGFIARGPNQEVNLENLLA